MENPVYMITQRMTFMVLGLISILSCRKDLDPQANVNPKRAHINDCLLCHSANEMQRGPSLEGMREIDFIKQVQKFKQGYRGRADGDHTGILMAEAVEQISDDNVKLLAQEFQDLTAKEIIQTVRGNSERGEKFYKQLCATCHGVNARGTDLGSALWTLEDWYLLSQLRKYKNGQRAYHPDDKESLIMKAVVNDLNDQDLKDVIKYLRDNFTPGT
jgi:uncharacterized protein